MTHEAEEEVREGTEREGENGAREREGENGGREGEEESGEREVEGQSGEREGDGERETAYLRVCLLFGPGCFGSFLFLLRKPSFCAPIPSIFDE